jgi:hypothetical protein
MRLRRATTAVLSAVAVGCLLAQGGACGGGSSSEVPSPGHEDGGAEAARPRPRVDGGDERDVSRPGAVPEGWVLHTDYDPYCGFYVPSDKKYLPAPVAWEPCSTRAGDAGLPGPPGIVCRRMTLDWDVGAPDAAHIAGWIPTFVGPSGQVTMMFRRFTKDFWYELIADADGPVHSALLETGPCLTTKSSASQGKVLYRVLDHPDSVEDNSGGAIGGDIDDLRPKVYAPKGYRPSTFFSHEYWVGPNAFVETAFPDRVRTFPAGDVVTTLLNAPEDPDLLYTLYQWRGDDLFWIGDSSLRTLVKVWTAGEGIHTLIGHGSDATRGVDGFGTDGVDMVWSEAFGRTNTSVKIYPNYEIWTAKYTTSPAGVEATKRRLRTEYLGSHPEANAVGCGYAAHRIYPPSTWGKSGFRLVRLSDGVSWEITTPDEATIFTGLRFGTPLAITCDEIFVLGHVKSNAEVARIRIDSLGVGLPPD